MNLSIVSGCPSPATERVRSVRECDEDAPHEPQPVPALRQRIPHRARPRPVRRRQVRGQQYIHTYIHTCYSMYPMVAVCHGFQGAGRRPTLASAAGGARPDLVFSSGGRPRPALLLRTRRHRFHKRHQGEFRRVGVGLGLGYIERLCSLSGTSRSE